MVQDDFTRSTDDPVSFFRLRALHLAPALGLTVAYVDERIAVLIGALGADWLNAEAGDVSPGIPLPMRRHPLGRLISTAGESQIREALELSEYLMVLHATPGIGETIAQLKAQYYQTVLQLAMAARCKAAGAADLVLEPAAADGRASDILFTLSGRAYRAECFRPTYDIPEPQHERVRLAQDLLDGVRERNVVLGIGVALAGPVTPPLRRAVLLEVRRMALVAEAESARAPGTLPSLLHRAEWGEVSVSCGVTTPPGAPPRLARHPDFSQQGDDHAVFLRMGLASIAKMTGVGGVIEGEVGGNHVAIWDGPPPEEDPAKSIQRLGRKIERKVSQTRGDEGAHRLLFVDAAESRFLADPGGAEALRLRGKVVEAHTGVAALVMLWRRWKPRLGRYGYDVVPLLRRDGDPDLEGLLKAIAEGEQAKIG